MLALLLANGVLPRNAESSVRGGSRTAPLLLTTGSALEAVPLGVTNQLRHSLHALLPDCTLKRVYLVVSA